MGQSPDWSFLDKRGLLLLFVPSTVRVQQIWDHSRYPNRTCNIQCQKRRFLFQEWMFRFLCMWFYLIYESKHTWDIDIKKMDFIHFCNHVTHRIDDKSRVKVFFFGLSWDWTNRVHLILGAFSLDCLQSGRVRKILGIVDHVLFCVWWVADFSQNRDIGALLACFG